jgi:hypothetical protein
MIKSLEEKNCIREMRNKLSLKNIEAFVDAKEMFSK